jgi:putative intracellular protease/amidase
MAQVLMLLPERDYDPTESAVPWAALRDAGHTVLFATPTGAPAYADERLVNTGFGPLNPVLMTQAGALAEYHRMIQDPAFLSPLAHAGLAHAQVDALLIPGGHAPGMRTLLESRDAQACVVAAFQARKPVAAVCHGVLLLARSVDPGTGRSVLHGRKTTALPKLMELSAWNMTRLRLGDYYRTYRVTVEDEVKAALASPKDFRPGGILPRRDTAERIDVGFTVRDGHYLSARWPGDCYRFAEEFVALLEELPAQAPNGTPSARAG